MSSQPVSSQAARETPRRAPAFGPEEHAARLATTRQAMDLRGLDALVVSDAASLSWLTGYEGWSQHAPQAAIVTMDRAPVWWGRARDRAGARATVWMNDASLIGYDEGHLVGGERHPFGHLAATLGDLGLGRGDIGVELDAPGFTAAAIGRLLADLGSARYHDATGLVAWRRVVKSPAELALMRRAARVADRVAVVFAERIEPGLRRSALLADIWAELIDGAEDASGAYGGETPALAPILRSGAEIAAPHLPSDDRPFQAGETSVLAAAACVRRYHAPILRTVRLGAPPSDLQRAEAAARAGLEAALASLKPGARAGAAATALRRAVAGKGGEPGADPNLRFGGSVGLGYPPDWSERTVAIRPDDATELLPGMTLHVSLAAHVGAEVFALGDTVALTERGAEPLTLAPKGLDRRG